MSRGRAQDNYEKLFKQREDLIKAHPSMYQSYSKFLQDLEKYRKFQQSQQKEEGKRQELNDYLIFGASFEK